MSTSSRRTQAVNDHIRRLAAEQDQDANRVRRSLVFQRLIARLAPAGLILKGGFCLEVRLPGTARSTRDVDFVGQLALVADPTELREELDDLLDSADIDDGFTFEVGAATHLRGDDAEANAWRISVAALLDGTRFEQIKLDLVGQVQEVMGATEQLVVPLPVQVDGAGPVTIEAVDVYQHAAEKFHAFARLYAHDRPSSRVKDLVDLVLLIEAGFVDDPRRLRHRLDAVYSQRDSATPATPLPTPPADWQRSYEAFATGLGLSAQTVPAAYALVSDTYVNALTERSPQ
ncbi:nucleotidyl transferase AbiEii/AbiGii toxin family protein [Flexivirga oryzae]|uniref:Nucleotidyl transferase AbiEii/AbiGii toxin family protein n=1 Tax=Flexivirga oryzae TaxID=1794944 RepID=A0A839NCH0_9MICO|nr:nucleotidyl transferase AbiEii/AbiGii toxin family protein [Flexivirga oryzae]MBB2892885.1 hypothetical protein [Flexivirga oryzae]